MKKPDRKLAVVQGGSPEPLLPVAAFLRGRLHEFVIVHFLQDFIAGRLRGNYFRNPLQRAVMKVEQRVDQSANVIANRFFRVLFD